MSQTERTAFLDAEKCLMNHEPITGEIPGARNVWDELHYTHIYLGNYIHYVGHFLPFHRYFVRSHEILLQQLCGYEGAHPYWDELYDLTNAPLNESSIFDPVYGFGGNGAGDSACIQDGPFKDLKLYMDTGLNPDTYEEYCLTRALKQSDLETAAQEYIDECLAINNYTSAWECYNGNPHGAGHGAVGGLMGDPIASNGDPTFYLHHAYLDKLWWEWQQEDPTNRLKDIGGPNTPPDWLIEQVGRNISSDILNYNGDEGNTTTSKHVIWTNNLTLNVTIAQIMDISSDTICAKYI
ncbi:unnamed protein product [Clonostachys rosea]|uniref:Tyrosinase copper-binding domain-containing protein n=1 Tax=Bionectria ochroleuca TaxID=29856 RepID=A0ABY6UBE0_BIOOC|nr:unnamed protein product [Clonostachys rosea]